MIGTRSEKDKSHWRDFVPTFVHAYNCTISNGMDFSPYYFMFGRKPRLPLDLYLVHNQQIYVKSHKLNLLNNWRRDYTGHMG